MTHLSHNVFVFDPIINDNNDIGVIDPNVFADEVNGFSLNVLNSLEYKGNNTEDGDNDYLHTEVICNYLPFNQLNRIKNDNQFNLLSYNIRSMKQNYDNFIAEAFERGNVFQVIGLCETHLTDDTEYLYKLPDYNFYSTNILSNKGGVCMYVKNCIPCKIRTDLLTSTNYLESVFVECVVDNEKLVIGMVYHRPGSSFPNFIEDFINLLEKIRCKCILLGDFNINILNEHFDNNVANFVNVMREHFYHPVITKPTRVQNGSATLLDHIWLNFDHDRTHQSHIIFSGITDHFPTTYHLKSNSVNEDHKVITYRVFNDQCDQNFKYKIENHDWNILHEIVGVNESFEYFNNVLSNYFNECYPVKTKRIKNNSIKSPWITTGLKESIKIKYKLYKKIVKRPITYGDRYRTYRNNLTRLIKVAKSYYYRDKFAECKGNSKKIWSNINNLLGKNQSNSNVVFRINNEDTMDENIIADSFNNYYVNKAHEIDSNLAASDRNFAEYLPNRPFNEIRWNLTSELEIKSIIYKSNNTNGGPDKLPMLLFKNNASFLAPIISHLCNKSLSSGIFPTVHKAGIVVPLYKSKERDDIKNYRPICLLNSMSKILERVIHTRLMYHLESNNILSDDQFAYRKSRGTDTAILKFTKNVIENLENGMITVAAFLDLTKAFDCVNHQILLRKLDHYGIRNVSLQWFSSYLRDRKQRVKFRNAISSEKTINIGVPQGSILGPLLFLIYFQDICMASDIGREILFADDATVYESGYNVFHIINSLNEKLFAISQWLLANRLSANAIKSDGMIFAKNNIYYPLPPLKLYGSPIAYNHMVKFLGVFIDAKLTWNFHIFSIQKKLSRASGVLYTLRNKIPRYIARTIYFCIAYPYLTYCNIVWGSCYQTNLKKIITGQKRLIRIIMKCNRTTHSDPLFKKLKLLKLNDIIKMNTALFVFKTINNLIYSPIPFTFRNVPHYRLRGNHVNLEVPYVRLRHSQLFVHVRGANLWNSIPQNLHHSPTVISFKRNLKNHYLNSYDVNHNVNEA